MQHSQSPLPRPGDSSESPAVLSTLLKGVLGCGALCFAFMIAMAVVGVVINPDPSKQREEEHSGPVSVPGSHPLVAGIGRSLQYFTAKNLLLKTEAPTEGGGCYTWDHPGFTVKMVGPDANLTAIMVTVPFHENDSMLEFELKLATPASIISLATGESVSPKELVNWIKQGGGERTYGDLRVVVGREETDKSKAGAVSFFVVHEDTDLDSLRSL